MHLTKTIVKSGKFSKYKLKEHFCCTFLGNRKYLPKVIKINIPSKTDNRGKLIL